MAVFQAHMLFPASEIIPDELGTVVCADAATGFEISYLADGTERVKAIKMDIYANTAASPLVYTTGKVILPQPVWPRDSTGTRRRLSLSVPVGSGLVNGNEYKLMITQWPETGAAVMQNAPSAFLCRGTPVLTVSAPATLAGRSCTVSATWQQSEGDGIRSLRWRLYQVTEAGDELIDDTGTLPGTGELSFSCDGLLPETDYKVGLEVASVNGICVIAQPAGIHVSYPLSPEPGILSAKCDLGRGCVLVRWTGRETLVGSTVYRRRGDSALLTRLADVPRDTGMLLDYGACSGESYTYYLFTRGAGAYSALPLVSNTVRAEFACFRIIEADENADGSFTAGTAHNLRCMNGEPEPGGISYNNAPGLSQGFSRFPICTRSPQNYLSGVLCCYAGGTGAGSYTDSAADTDTLAGLADRTGPLFLLTPKGRLLRIRISGAVTASIDYRAADMPQLVRIPWAQTAQAREAAIVSYSSGGFIPADMIVFAQLALDPATGALTMTVPAAYSGTSLALTQQGCLEATAPAESVIPAQLTLSDSNDLMATISI